MEDHVFIGEKRIGYEDPCFIIAEAGINHNGDEILAKKLIDVAQLAGADAVKFQTFHAEMLVTESASKAEYQQAKTSSEESQYEMLQRLELSDETFFRLSEYAIRKGILFLSTPFDEQSVDLLDDLAIPAFKIPSGEITNNLLLRKVASKQKPVILSTGMSTLGEVENAVRVLRTSGSGRIVLLHCTTSYPAPVNSVNLRAMETLRCAFKVPVGYSDHTEGITIPVAAAAMGARVIEKHFTLNRTFPGPDHQASIEPHTLSEMVIAIRNVEQALGSGLKTPTQVEENIIQVARRSIVANKDIIAGEILSADLLSVKRPGTGISPQFLELVIGKRAKRDIRKNSLITWDIIE